MIVFLTHFIIIGLIVFCIMGMYRLYKNDESVFWFMSIMVFVVIGLPCAGVAFEYLRKWYGG